MTDLEELLARATALEEKADALDPETADPAEVAEIKAEVAELRETLDVLAEADRGRLEPWEADDLEQGQAELDQLDPAVQAAVFGADPDEPAPTPVEEPAPVVPEPVELTDEELAGKSWEPCTEHPAADRDEFKDGTAACTECGTPLLEAKGVDFDDADADLDPEFKVDDAPVEEKTGGELETKGGGLSEMELLLARRARLGA